MASPSAATFPGSRLLARSGVVGSAAAHWSIYAVLFASTSVILGVIWDISWHRSIGRDTFWTPAHLAIYLGGIVAGLTSGWVARTAATASTACSICLCGTRRLTTTSDGCDVLPPLTAGGRAVPAVNAQIPERNTAPPPVVVRGGGETLELHAWTFCYGTVDVTMCADGMKPDDPPSVGEAPWVEIAFPLPAWTFRAQFETADQACPRSFEVPVTRLGDTTWLLEPGGPPGNYDVTLSWTPDQMPQRPPGAPEPPPADPNGPSIFTALQEQLGLKLDSQKGPVSVLVIDRVERPKEN